MSDRTARILVTLALVPGCFGVYIAVFEGRVPLFSQILFQSFGQVAALLTLALTQVFVIRLWRGFVAWTLWRVLATALLSVLACYEMLILPIDFELDRQSGGFEEVSSGIIACAIWAVWWGLLTIFWWGLSREERNMSSGVRSSELFRYGASIALVPLYVGVFMLLASLLGRGGLFGSGWIDFVTASLALCNALIVVAWLLIWGGCVRWTWWKFAVVAILAILTIVSPGTMLMGQWFTIWRPLRESGPLFGLAIWLAGTAWTWRNRESSTLIVVPDSDRIRCPQCNYSLKGLKEVHCPECGWTSTVDQIVKLAFENAATV